MRDRVFADENKRNLFERLCLDKKEKIFNTNKDLFLFAAALGYKHNKRIPLTKKGTEIPLSVFQNNKQNFYFIDILALGDTEDINILDWDNNEIVERKLTIIEEYANAGLKILNKKLIQEPGDIFDNLLHLIYKELKNKEGEIDLTYLKNLIEQF